MDGLFTLLGLSLLMGVVSFVIGSLPLTFTLSSSQSRLISALGMGLLVGTSMIVIIPEGVETLYSSSLASHQHSKRDVAFGTGIQWDRVPENILSRRTESEEAELLDVEIPSIREKPKEDKDKSSENEKESKDSSEEKHDKVKPPAEKKPEDSKHEESPHAWIGIGLISGFILMYLVDKIPQFASSSSKQQQRPYHISLDNLGSGLSRGSTPSQTTSGVFDLGGGSPRQGNSQSLSTTAGLVIHAAADGIALGASTSSAGLSFIIFIAIMVHKAPASFGLTSVLLKQGLSNRAVRGHLLVFSLAAPIGAILTWLIAHTIMAGHAGDEQATKWRTGVLLLFSAGTFLYVAVHTMQDTFHETARRDYNGNGYIDGREPAQRPKQSMRDLVASIIGMILPLFLQVGHAH